MWKQLLAFLNYILFFIMNYNSQSKDIVQQTCFKIKDIVKL